MAADNSFTDDANWVTDSRSGVSYVPPSLKQATTGAIPVGHNDGVHRGVISFDSRTGEVEQRKVIGQYAGHGSEAAGDVMSTYRDAFGSATRNYQDNGTVQYGGMQIAFKQALEMGLVQRTAIGGYEDAAAPVGGTDPKKADEADDALSSVELFPADVEATYGALIAPISQGNYDATMAAGTLAVAGGDLTEEEVIDHMSRKLSQAEGGSAQQHQRAAGAAMALFGNQVAMTLEAAGVPKGNHADLYAFTRSTEQGRRELQQALTQLVAARNSSGFAKLAEQFFQCASPTVESLRAAGYIVRRLPGRGFEVELEDGSFQSIDELRYERPAKR